MFFRENQKINKQPEKSLSRKPEDVSKLHVPYGHGEASQEAVMSMS